MKNRFLYSLLTAHASKHTSTHQATRQETPLFNARTPASRNPASRQLSRRLITSCLLAACMLLTCMTFVSCDAPEKSSTVKIGIAAPDVTHGWVAGVTYYAEQYCKNNNITYKITTSSDAAEMAAGLQDLVAWGADAIVIYPQWEGMESAIAEIVADGIPVVNFDIDIAVDGVYKVAGDNYGMGYESARYIIERAGKDAAVVIMDVPSFGSVASLRKAGFYEYYSENGIDTSNITEVTCETFTREVGLKTMSDVLLSHNKIDAVFSYDDELSLGCIQAITEAGRTDIKAITGGGGMQEYFWLIANEKYKDLGPASVLYSPIMIQDAVKIAMKICNGETAEKETIVPTTVVSYSNVEGYIDANNTIY